MLKRVKRNKKGFTLAELLIVVAIIAVLVAISIPIFTSQLEKSREATDLANIRAAYAEASVKALETEADATVDTVTMTQATSGWGKITDATIGKYSTAGTPATGYTAMPAVQKGDVVSVTVKADGTGATITKK